MNEGASPSRKKLSKILAKSTRDISPSMRRVQARMQENESRTAAMPSMPVELRDQGDEFLKALWTTTKELASEEAKEVRLLLEVSKKANTSVLEELEELVGELEDERDAALERAATAENCNAELSQQLSDLQQSFDAAKSRLEERDEILAMITRPLDQPDKNGKAKGLKTSKPAAEADDAETGDLPMVIVPAPSRGHSA